MAGVTVRTLHHYDEIGLLSPAGRSQGGRREYDDADVARLQQILFYRELGFGLEEITDLLERDADTDAHLRRQRTLLAEKIRRLQEMSTAVEEALSAHVVGLALSASERLAVFGRWRPRDGYVDEAQQRWGSTKQWQQGRERMAGYSAADLARMQEETETWVNRLRELVTAGVDPRSPEAMDLAEDHRLSLGRWLFDCDHDMHCEFARLCADDEDQLAFLVRPDRQLPGMGTFLRDAALANARR